MAHPGFGHLWQQPELSDAEVVISAPETAAQDSSNASEVAYSVLQRFPGHTQILGTSPYFLAQALRWSTHIQSQDSTKTSTSDTAGSSNTAGSRDQAGGRQVPILLPDASYEPAALAVLAGMYAVKPWAQLFGGLTPQQQVQAAVLADMWQLPDGAMAAISAALQMLQAATDSTDRVTAVLEQLLAMAAMPDCLQALFEQTLLFKFGDLEAVWDAGAASSATMQTSMLALPLHGMELLLASDKLQDTVLYTAQAYVDAQTVRDARQLAADRLAPLVRCPHLSQFWLSASVLADDADKWLLGGLQPQLKRLLLMLLRRSALEMYTGLRVEDLEAYVPEAPASWLLPVRNITTASSRELEWELDVAAIKQAAQNSAMRQECTYLISPSSCLLGGVMWSLVLGCVWDAGNSGSDVGVYIVPQELPVGALCRCTFRVECNCVGIARAEMTGWVGEDGTGWLDWFGVGTMAGGFDEAAWAAKGLPTAGSILMKLTVQDVGE